MKKLKYLILIIVIPLMMSCESFLDTPPRDQISNDSYWKRAEDLESYIKQYYPDLPKHGNVFDNTISFFEAESDNTIIGVPNSRINGENTVTVGTWTDDWVNIRSINIFFDNYQKCQEPFDSYKHFLGEAYYFKASFYFSLVKKYGDVAWYNKPIYPDDEELLHKARDPRTLVVDSILAQLDKAILYLDKRIDANGNNNRLNKEAALAFKTRVALYEGTWQKYHSMLNDGYATPGADPTKYFQASVNAAQELMNGDYWVGIYNTGHPEEDYYTMFGTVDMSDINEVLLYRTGGPESEHAGNNINWYATITPGHSGLTWSFVTSYLDRNGEPYDYLALAQTAKGSNFLTTIAANCDPRLEQTIWIPGQLMIAPTGRLYTVPPIEETGDAQCPTGFQYRKYNNPTEPITVDRTCKIGYIISRYADVLLDYAEAKYELDGTVAYDQLNLLRARAGMPDFAVIPQGSDPNRLDYGYTISDALYEIRRERRVETIIEGERIDDLRRWAAHNLFVGKRPKGYPVDFNEFPDYLSIGHMDENGLIDFFKNVIPNGYGFRPGQDYLDDIPQTELVLNPNLTQNPGW